jgi:hypothetical protein
MGRSLKIVAIVTIILMAILGCYGMYKLAYLFSPGSYPYAEKYEFNVKEADLINAVEFFKINNVKYCQPPQTQLKDGRHNPPNNHWYFIYFYYPEENQIIFTWIREVSTIWGGKKTVFAFVSVNDGLELGHWKDINDNISDDENELQKKKFEDRILKKVEEKLGMKHNW